MMKASVFRSCRYRLSPTSAQARTLDRWLRAPRRSAKSKSARRPEHTVAVAGDV